MQSISSLPGPRPMPIVGWRGNVARFFHDAIGYMAPLTAYRRGLVPFAQGGAGPVLFSGTRPGATVFAFGPVCNQAVYGQMAAFHSQRLPGPPESRSFARLTAGLFNMNDDHHRGQRRLLQPAFHRQRLDGYAGIMAELTARAIERWRAGDVRDLSVEMQRLTLAVANKALFGREPSPGVVSLGEQIQDVIERAISPATLIPLDLPLSPRRRLVEAAARLEEELRAVIAERRAAGDGGDVLSALLAARDEDGSVLTEDELLGHIFLLFFAGHDTTKSAVAWTVFLLSQHPRIEADLRDEIRGVVGGGGAPTVEQLGRMPLLERVIKESLRLFPPAPFSARVSTADTEIAGVAIPARAEVIVSPYCTHRDPDLYPAPQAFRPERWETIAPSPYEYVPFGAGQRTCIGAGFAMMELKIVLSMLLDRHGFDLPEGARIDRRTRVVLSQQRGMPMTLRAPSAAPRRTSAQGNVREMVDLPS